jgi:protein-S-isoprenylcysteine O-methyltransferase Ste14
VPTLQVGLPVFKVMVRIRDEQEVLQKEFENEWGDYHRVTNRFLPGIL